MNKDNIANIRQKIDSVDKEILILLIERFELSKQIAKHKDQKLIKDKKREEEIVKNLQKIGKENNLSPKLIEDLYSIIFKYSIAEIKNVLSKNT